MSIFQKKEKIKIIKFLEQKESLWVKEAALVSISGTGALKKEPVGTVSREYEGDVAYHLTINGDILAKTGEPSCPTCAAILAAGYGREHTDLEEILHTGQRLNESFISLEDSIEKAAPLLWLLEPGIYVIADIMACPADGNGRFFWDFPKEACENPAAADSVYTSYFHCQSGHPIFLYPTQGADRLNGERVEYYRERYRKEGKDRFPRTVAYNLYGHVSALLDGHHKACGAALEGGQIPCLTIIPFQGFTFRADQKKKGWIKDKALFADFQVKLEKTEPWVRKELEDQLERKMAEVKNLGDGENGRTGMRISLENGPLSRREWEEAYKESAYVYPDAETYGEIMEYGLDGEISDEQIKEAMEDISGKRDGYILALLAVLALRKNQRLKKLAMECIRGKRDYSLQKQAFQSLLAIKGDEEVEEFMMEYLVEEPVVGDKLRELAFLYFQNSGSDEGNDMEEK